MIRSLFSGNRHSTPLGPPPGSGGPDSGKNETLQSVRLRQRKKHQSYLAQILRAEQEYEQLLSTDTEKAAQSKQTAQQLSHAADILSGQIMVIERILEEFGLMNEIEEERRREGEEIDEMRRQYEQGGLVTDIARRESKAAIEAGYMNAMGTSFMMPSEVMEEVDEDEAMRDLEETAKLTGRT